MKAISLSVMETKQPRVGQSQFGFMYNNAALDSRLVTLLLAAACPLSSQYLPPVCSYSVHRYKKETFCTCAEIPVSLSSFHSWGLGTF